MSTWMADEDAALLLSGSIRLNPCGRTTGATGTGYMSLASPANPGDAGALGGSSDLTLCLCSRCTGDEPRLGVADAPLLGVVSPLICARNSSASRSFFFSLAVFLQFIRAFIVCSSKMVEDVGIETSKSIYK
uniref:Uncharacterized protein n=1 Tax=Oryza barthii TaxID=65489 RepID=A0A0D3FDC3_9ORYZ